MRNIILTAWLSLWIVSLSAQEIRVLDAKLNMPLERATITNLSNMVSASTNDEGKVKLQNLGEIKPSTHFEIRCMGYRPFTLSAEALKQLNYQVKLSPSVISLDQVVVSATRWSQSSRELPYQISALSAKEVSLQNPQTTADLLEQSGKVFIQKSQQGGGSPMIRGFATNRLLIAVDGIRMNNAIFRSGNLQNVISLDPFSIERTEVYFGPGSVIYGSDAIGGVMSFSTLEPELSSSLNTEVSGKAVARYSSANKEFSQHFDVNIGWEKWALRSSVSHYNYGDLRMGSHGPDEYLRPFRVQRIDSTDRVLPNENPELQYNTGFRQNYLMQKVRYKPNVNWDITYALHYSETSDYGRNDRLLRTKNGKPRSAEWYYGPQIWQMNNLNLSYAKNNLFFDKATLRLAQQRFVESRHDRDFGRALLNSTEEEVWAYSANLDFLKRISKSHKVFYGFEGVYNTVNSNGSVENINTGLVSDGPDRYPQSTWQSYAVYFNHEWEASDKFTTQLGARYNQFMIAADFSDNLDYYPLPVASAQINNGALTGALGFVYRPNSEWKIQSNVSTAFRAPNIDDLGKVFDSGERIVVVPNPNLNAEYAYNAELGLARLIGEALKLDLTAYFTYLNQALVRRPFTLGTQDSIVYNNEMSQVQAVQNAARATVFGLQFGFEWQLANGFTLSSTLNMQEGEEELESGLRSPSRHAAPLFGITRLEFENKELTLQLYTQYSAAVAADDLNVEERNKPYIYATNQQGRPYSPAWYTLNFKAMYHLDTNWSITAGVENISDQRYRPYSSGLVAPGRNVIMALRLNF